MTTRTKIRTSVLLVLVAALLVVPIQRALALREGGVGNSPLQDPGWPKGAAVLMNTEHRIAFWHGPLPGHWHADCRGDAKAFNFVLADFAKVEVKSKLLVVHNGIGNSEWLNISNDPARREKAKMDWMFTTWQTEDWKRDSERGRRGRGEKVDPKDAEDGPPAQIDVYTGGNIKWADVRVPPGIKVMDMRLEAHGYTLADGVVLEGKVVDLATKKPLVAVMRLERVEPQPKGDPTYVNVAGAVASGNWVLKNTPAGWHRIVVEAPGYVPREVGGAIFDQPKWESYDTELVRGALVAGRVTDDAGQPLTDVVVRIDVRTEGGGYYAAARAEPIKTGKDGRFRAKDVPLGKATISVAKAGYNRRGPELSFTTPKSDVELSMFRGGRVEVTVDFTGRARPEEYLVQIDPEGGSKIGSWGGVSRADANNEVIFENVPPGRYVLVGHPNPTTERQRTAPVTVNVKGAATAKATLKAK